MDGIFLSESELTIDTTPIYYKNNGVVLLYNRTFLQQEMRVNAKIHRKDGIT